MTNEQKIGGIGLTIIGSLIYTAILLAMNNLLGNPGAWVITLILSWGGMFAIFLCFYFFREGGCGGLIWGPVYLLVSVYALFFVSSATDIGGITLGSTIPYYLGTKRPGAIGANDLMGGVPWCFGILGLIAAVIGVVLLGQAARKAAQAAQAVVASSQSASFSFDSFSDDQLKNLLKVVREQPSSDVRAAMEAEVKRELDRRGVYYY